MRKAPPERATIRRIAVVKLSSLGDIIHALPAVHQLHSQLDATVDWVVQTEYVDLVKCFPSVSRVIPFPRRELWGHAHGFISELRRDTYDLIVDLQGLLKSAFVSRLMKGRYRVGPSFSREGSILFYDAIARSETSRNHAVDECLNVIRWLGLVPESVSFPIRFPKIELAEATPRIAMLPLSRWPSKNWPESYFIDAAKELQKCAGATIYVLGGGTHAERETCARMTAAIGGNVIDLSGRTSIVMMGSYFREMNIVISNDSGPMHLAAALGIPVVALFGPTMPERTGPYGAPQRVLHPQRGECAGCRSRACRKGDLSCLVTIKPRRVVDATLELLG